MARGVLQLSRIGLLPWLLELRWFEGVLRGKMLLKYDKMWIIAKGLKGRGMWSKSDMDTIPIKG